MLAEQWLLAASKEHHAPNQGQGKLGTNLDMARQEIPARLNSSKAIAPRGFAFYLRNKQRGKLLIRVINKD